MMISYSGLTKLRTKQVVFDEVFGVCDSNSLELLKDMSSKRRAIQESIDDSSSVTEAVAREMSGGLTSRCEQDIQKLEMYLPLLENLVFEVSSNIANPCMLHWISELKLRWTSVLASSSLLQNSRSKYYQIDDLRFEYTMVLFLYGAMLRDAACENLPKDLAQSANLFRKASGVYQHLAHEVLPVLDLSMAAERPPESVSNVASVMSLICLAETQATTARKAEEKGSSPSLLAKLHFGVSDFLDEASRFLYSARKECNNISSRLADFIANTQALHSLRSHKYLAESLKNEGRIGAAIGVLHQSKKDAEKISPKESCRVGLKQLIEEVTELKRKYDHENDFVWHEKIPSQFSLPSPEPVKLATALPYQSQRLDRALLFKK